MKTAAEFSVFKTHHFKELWKTSWINPQVQWWLTLVRRVRSQHHFKDKDEFTVMLIIYESTHHFWGVIFSFGLQLFRKLSLWLSAPAVDSQCTAVTKVPFYMLGTNALAKCFQLPLQRFGGTAAPQQLTCWMSLILKLTVLQRGGEEAFLCESDRYTVHLKLQQREQQGVKCCSTCALEEFPS